MFSGGREILSGEYDKTTCSCSGLLVACCRPGERTFDSLRRTVVKEMGVWNLSAECGLCTGEKREKWKKGRYQGWSCLLVGR